MRRKKRSKFKLSKKQKQNFTVAIVAVICAIGAFWMFAKPIAIKTASQSNVKKQTVYQTKTKSFVSSAVEKEVKIQKSNIKIAEPSRQTIQPVAAQPVTSRPPVIKNTLPKRAVPDLYSNRPKVTFVIDDIGYHLRDRDRLAALSDKVTYAILPLLPFSRYFGNLSKATGAEVILHLPLDTTQDIIPGKGLIVDTMSDQDILDMLSRDISSVPNLVGSNNHMGSRGTTNRRVMTIILKELKRRGLFFLDSYTTADSVVPQVAKEINLPILTRGVFLDNVDEKNAIARQITDLRRISRARGSAIAIGHYRTNTLEVLANEIPAMEDEGFVILTLQEMLSIHAD